jgi:site-specific DNA recombinase
MSKKEDLYCYLRVSSKVQEEEGNSIDNQRFLGQRVSKKLGLNYVEMNEGHYSTTSKSRPKLEEIKQGIRIGKIKNVWYYSRSRWTRDDTEDSLIRLHYFQKYKTKVYEGENGSLRKYNSPQDRMLDSIFTTVQQFDRENRREVSVSGKKHLSITQGHTGVFMGGKINFGYSNVDKKWTIDNEETKWVKKIFNMYLQGKSLVEIKELLDSNGVSPRRSKVWNIGTLLTMLKNRVYIGEYNWKLKDPYNKEVILEEFLITVPQIISHSVFNRVQKMINKNQKNKGNNSRKYESLLSDLLVCYCGENITGVVKTTLNKNGYKSYGCRSNENKYKGKKVNPCDNSRRMDMDKTDELVISEIKNVVGNSSILKERFKSDVMKNKDKDSQKITDEKKDIEIQIKRIDTHIESVVKSLSSVEVNQIIGEITDKRVIETTKKTLNEELGKLDDKKKGLIQEIDDLDNRKDWIDWISKYGKDNLKRFNKPTSELLNGFINEIIVSPSFEKNRDGKNKQIGHKFKVKFSSPIVNDSVEYVDDTKKSKGYTVINGKKTLDTGELVISKGGRPKKKVN